MDTMNIRHGRLYQIGEFADRTGVTIRALHHYDELGLLKPSVVAESGYRLYSDADVVRLQQIVTLKFIGLTLKQIREVFAGEAYDAATMLRMQRKALEERRRQLDRAIEAIDTAERFAGFYANLDPDAFLDIIQVTTMADMNDLFAKYYTPEQMAEFERRATENPNEARDGERAWAELIREVEASVHEDPASEKAQALAARWSALVDGFTQGNPEIEARLKRMHEEGDIWKAMPRPYSDAALAFITQAQEIRRQRNAS